MDPRLDDEVRRARSGDPRAFRTITEHLGPEIVRFLTGYLNGDVHAAHDVAQETFLRAWDALDRIQDGRHLRHWCYRVARCKAVSWLRRSGPRGRHTVSLDICGEEGTPFQMPWSYDPEPEPEQPDGLLLALRRALRRLPPNYAGPVHLHYVQGYSTHQTAELLGLRRNAVKMRLHRARAFLLRELEREADPSAAVDLPRRPTP